MTVEELLRPRYKVTADFPGNNRYPIGKTVTVVTDQYAVSDNGYPVFWCEFEEYPHLFKKLEWWQERAQSDMPDYVKVSDNNKLELRGQVRKVHLWVEETFEGVEGVQKLAYIEDYRACYIERYICGEPPFGRLNAAHLMPATESDYMESDASQTALKGQIEAEPKQKTA